MTKGKILFENERKSLADAVKVTYYRKNTNTAGGNFSFKHTDNNGDDYIIMTPSMMSEAYHGLLSPSQILVVDLKTEKVVVGEGELTREINMHMACYKTNPDIRCVFHAHAPNAMFWATSGLDMPNLTEATQKIEHIKVLGFAPNTTPELAEIVKNELKNNSNLPKEYLLNSHGVLILTPGSDGIEALNKALQIIDTVEWNAEIAYKQTIFQKLGILDGYYSEGEKVGSVDELTSNEEIWNKSREDKVFE
ncbi:aldolase [Tetragenococcus halophilus]|uniref:Aldolase n=1 Tax=Tetragenococcus halophilus TaxID=51669 RepID=A0A3G5FH41_TETHA|nr:class II aldolase/adducin family protein [Tetragenococcus halophilus]AYW49663.1 aldolase [Tetragenococcus halophilus]GBD64755.1 Class II Aldolase and Adducin N-terminal domain protein [Tetragenococcus halophilus subsp. flandriensis]